MKAFITISSLAVLFLCIITLPLAFWTDRSFDFWLSMVRGTEVNCPFMLSFFATVFTNIFGVAFNLMSEIIRLFITVLG